MNGRAYRRPGSTGRRDAGGTAFFNNSHLPEGSMKTPACDNAADSKDAAPPIPKPLWQVLEEEFVELGGELKPDYQQDRAQVLEQSKLHRWSQEDENQRLCQILYQRMHARAAGHDGT